MVGSHDSWLAGRGKREDSLTLGLILLVLLVALIFAGLGIALHVLWVIAAILLVVWLLGFLVSGAEHSWYRVKRR
jgi:energy-coupling factor transporter transmembrane protein EcfT